MVDIRHVMRQVLRSSLIHLVRLSPAFLATFEKDLQSIVCTCWCGMFVLLCRSNSNFREGTEEFQRPKLYVNGLNCGDLGYPESQAINASMEESRLASLNNDRPAVSFKRADGRMERVDAGFDLDLPLHRCFKGTRHL